MGGGVGDFTQGLPVEVVQVVARPVVASVVGLAGFAALLAGLLPGLGAAVAGEDPADGYVFGGEGTVVRTARQVEGVRL